MATESISREEASDKRKYRRLQTDWLVNLRRSTPGEETRILLKERIASIGQGGVFIETPDPYALGTLITFDFSIPGLARVVHATGMVRWSNPNPSGNLPAGMGIEFLKATTEMSEAITDYIRDRMAGRQIARLTRTPLHQRILRKHKGWIGKCMKMDELVETFREPHDRLLEALNDLACYRLVEFLRDQIFFRPPVHPEITRAVDLWMSGHPEPPALEDE